MADTTIRNFSMSYGELIGICSSVYGFMQRDDAEFLLYGVTPVLITNFNDTLQDFIDLPQDQELEAIEINKTYVKNELANELRIVLRSYNTRAKLVFNENAGIYNLFYKKDMNKLNDRDLHLFAEMVKDSAVTYITELSAVGLTPAMNTALATLITNFYNAMFDQKQATANRDNAVKERIEKANELYALLTRYCEIGKTIWYETNEAKYNDYLIYTGSSPGSLDKPKGISFNIANMKVSWDTLENATSYIASISTDGGASYQEVYSGSDTFFVYQPTYFGTVSVLIKGHNSGGNGPASDPYTFTYFDVLPSPEGLTISLVSETTGLIRLNFEDVASATTYKIFRSVVALGMPAGEFTYITEQPGIEYVGNTTAGMRNWFHVKAGNATQLSVASAAVFMDMAVIP